MANLLRLYPGVSVSGIEEVHTEAALRIMDLHLRDVGPAIKAANDAIAKLAVGSFPSVSYVTVANESPVLPFARQLAATAPITIADGGAGTQISIGAALGTPSITLGLTAAAGGAGTLIRSDATIAAFDAVAPADLAASASVGTINFAARRDHVHRFPISLEEYSFLSTAALSSDGVNQTLTGSLGNLIITASGAGVSLPKLLGLGLAAPDPLGGDMISAIYSSVNYPALASAAGLHMEITRTGAGGRMEGFRFISTDDVGLTGTVLESVGVESRFISKAITGTATYTNRAAYEARVDCPTGAGVTITDQYGLNVLSWHSIGGTPGTYTNARGVNVQLPTLGNTIRRGVHVNATNTFNFGTEAANVEGFFCDAIPRGLTNRRAYGAAGATNGTPTSVVILEQTTAHAVGTTRRFLKGIDPSEVLGGYMGSYTPGSFTVPTGEYMIVSNHLILTGAQNITLQGTAHLSLVS